MQLILSRRGCSFCLALGLLSACGGGSEQDLADSSASDSGGNSSVGGSFNAEGSEDTGGTSASGSSVGTGGSTAAGGDAATGGSSSGGHAASSGGSASGGKSPENSGGTNMGGAGGETSGDSGGDGSGGDGSGGDDTGSGGAGNASSDPWTEFLSASFSEICPILMPCTLTYTLRPDRSLKKVDGTDVETLEMTAADFAIINAYMDAPNFRTRIESGFMCESIPSNTGAAFKMTTEAGETWQQNITGCVFAGGDDATLVENIRSILDHY